jgi:hypothetical protein
VAYATLGLAPGAISRCDPLSFLPTRSIRVIRGSHAFLRINSISSGRCSRLVARRYATPPSIRLSWSNVRSSSVAEFAHNATKSCADGPQRKFKRGNAIRQCPEMQLTRERLMSPKTCFRDKSRCEPRLKMRRTTSNNLAALSSLSFFAHLAKTPRPPTFSLGGAGGAGGLANFRAPDNFEPNSPDAHLSSLSISDISEASYLRAYRNRLPFRHSSLGLRHFPHPRRPTASSLRSTASFQPIDPPPQSPENRVLSCPPLTPRS